MSIVLTCDQCGEPIADDEDYISGQLTPVEASPNPNEPPQPQQPVRVDWHLEHAPEPVQLAVR